MDIEGSINLIGGTYKSGGSALTPSAVADGPATVPGSVLSTIIAGNFSDAVAHDNIGQIWVANYGGNSVQRYLASDGSPVGTPITNGAFLQGPGYFAFDGTNMWVSSETPGNHNITKISLDGSSVTSYATAGSSPYGMVSNGTYLWVCNQSENTVTKHLVSDGSVAATITIGSNAVDFNGPAIIIIGPNPNFVWVTNGDDNSVYKINTDGTNNVSGPFSTGGTYPLGLTTDGTYIYVANQSSSNLSKLDQSGASVGGSPFPIGQNPQDLAYDGTYVWSVNSGFSGSPSVQRILPSDCSVVNTYPRTSPYAPNGITFVSPDMWFTEGNAPTSHLIEMVGIPTPTDLLRPVNVANGLVSIDSGGKLPALDGSNLTGVSASVFVNSPITGNGTSGSHLALDSSVVTEQGNTFNLANKLVKLDGSAKLPAVDGSQLTGLPGSTSIGAVLMASATNSNFAPGGDGYYAFGGTPTDHGITPPERDSVFPATGSIKRFFVKMRGTPVPGSSVSVALLQNSLEVAGTSHGFVDTDPNGTIFDSGVLSVAITAGDLISYKVTETGSASSGCTFHVSVNIA